MSFNGPGHPASSLTLNYHAFFSGRHTYRIDLPRYIHIPVMHNIILGHGHLIFCPQDLDHVPYTSLSTFTDDGENWRWKTVTESAVVMISNWTHRVVCIKTRCFPLSVSKPKLRLSLSFGTVMKILKVYVFVLKINLYMHIKVRIYC